MATFTPPPSRVRRIIPLFALLFATTAHAEAWHLSSPNGRVQFEIERSSEGLPRYSVKYDGNVVIQPSRLGVRTSWVAEKFSTPEVTRRSVDEIYHVVLGKTAAVPDRYNEMTLRFRATNEGRDIELVFRAYDEGAAFRHILPPQPDIPRYTNFGERTEDFSGYTIFGESTEFAFPSDYACWGSNIGQFYTSHEAEFEPVMASKIRPFNNYDAPLVCKTGHGETTFALAESDVENYPGAYYARPWSNALGVAVRLV